MSSNIRDFNSLRRRVLRFLKNMNWQDRIVAVMAVIGLASAAVWLVRDIQTVADDFGPAEGSLLVNINTATQEELESIPRVGPTLAAQIIAGRPYENVDELIRISGIGPSSLDGMRPFMTTDEETRKKE